MASEYESREAFLDDLKQQYRDGRFRDAVELLQNHDYEVDQETTTAIVKRYKAAKKIGKKVGTMPEDREEASKLAEKARKQDHEDLAETVATIYQLDQTKPDEDDTDRLYDVGQEALPWPDSEHQERGTQTVYHATDEDGAKGIIEDGAIYGRRGEPDHVFDQLKVYIMQDKETMEQNSTINPAEYARNHREELLEDGPASVREAIEDQGFEKFVETMDMYETDMDVNEQTGGTRRELGAAVGDTKERAKGGARYDADAVFELTLPEDSRLDEDVPGGIPLSYTDRIHVSPDKLDVVDELQTMLAERDMDHIEVVEDQD